MFSKTGVQRLFGSKIRNLRTSTVASSLKTPYSHSHGHCNLRRDLKFFSSNVSTNETTPHRRGGGIWIGIGWALLGLVTIDQLLQYRQEQEAEEHRRLLYLMQEEANEDNKADWDQSLPTLFRCKIAHIEPSLDGTKMLRHIGVGDVVDILQADIGPNKAYHLCRNRSSDRPGSTGWYPIQYMERME